MEMNAVIQCYGKFHAPHLAAQLHRKQALSRVITGYPRFTFCDRGGVPKELVCSFPLNQFVERLAAKLGLETFEGNRLGRLYDRVAANFLPPNIDLVTAWSGSALETLRAASHQGAKTVLERGSGHIRYEAELLRRERRTQFGAQRVSPITNEENLQREEREYEEADVIVVPSEFAKKTFVQSGVDAEKVKSVPLGVDAEKLTPCSTKSDEDDVFRLIFCGRLGPRKGARYLLTALEELDFRDWNLLCIGDVEAPIRQKFESHSNVTLMGRLPHDELAEWYSRGSVLVLPSVADGFGMVVLEAMACQLPVIVTGNVGAADVVRHGKDGFVIEPRNARQLAERLTEMYESENLRRSMAHNAMNRAREFTWDDYGDRVYRMYEQILEQTPATEFETVR